jgi:hypothetical protein
MPRPSMPEGLTATVYRYAVRGDLPPEAIEELRRAHRLRNKLVEVELGYQDALAAAWSTHPEIADAENRRDEAGEIVAELVKRAKTARAAGRTTRPDPYVATALKEARAVHNAAKAEIRDLKDRYYASEIKPLIVAAGEARSAATKGTYADAISGGLYWGTYNDVLDHHKTAVSQMRQKRSSRKPAQMRFHRWTGEGTLAVQLQRQVGDPVRTPETIASAGPWSNVAQLGPWDDPETFAALARHQRRKAARRGVLRFRIGSHAIIGSGFAAQAEAWLEEHPVTDDVRRVLRVMAAHAEDAASADADSSGVLPYRGVQVGKLQKLTDLPSDRFGVALEVLTQEGQIAGEGTSRRLLRGVSASTYVTVPVTIHRMLPPGADIVGMRITRRMLAGKPQVSVSLTVRVGKAPARTEGRQVAVHSGWRALPDGALRIAVIAGAERPPANLDEVVRNHGDWAEVVIPAGWRDLYSRGEGIQSRRDKSMEQIRARILDWLAQHPDAREGIDPDGTLSRWRSPARFAALALRLRDAPPEDGEGLARDLEAWRKQDKHLWQWVANERDQLLGMRNEAYRRVAAWVASKAYTVTMDSWEVAPLARRPDVTQEDDPQAQAARANRVLAAPAVLRDKIRTASRRLGAQVTEPEDADAASHYVCGTPLAASQRMAQVAVWCARCETMVDQDWNTLQTLLATARGDTGASAPIEG